MANFCGIIICVLFSYNSMGRQVLLCVINTFPFKKYCWVIQHWKYTNVQHCVLNTLTFDKSQTFVWHSHSSERIYIFRVIHLTLKIQIALLSLYIFISYISKKKYFIYLFCQMLLKCESAVSLKMQADNDVH